MYETGLISPGGEIISIPYYEIGIYSEEICKKYISESEQNKIEFEKFSKEYQYFKPYFDFVIFRLGYKIINPFLKEDTIGYAIGNFFVTKSMTLNSKTRIKKYTGVSNQDLQITNYKDITLKEGFIDANGIGFKVNRNLEMEHSKLCELILNQWMIYSKEIYDDYMNCITNPDINKIITRIEFYMIKRFSFSQMCIFDTDLGSIIYNDDELPEWYDEFKNIFENTYEYVAFLPISEEIDLKLEPLHMRKRG